MYPKNQKNTAVFKTEGIDDPKKKKKRQKQFEKDTLIKKKVKGLEMMVHDFGPAVNKKTKSKVGNKQQKEEMKNKLE